MCVSPEWKAKFAEQEEAEEKMAYIAEFGLEHGHEAGAWKLNGQAREFILAGDAVVTVVNAETGNRFTYRVVRPREDSPHFVRVLTGPDNDNDYTFLGTIFDETSYRPGKRSRISPDALSARAWAWTWTHLDDLPDNVEIWHEGRCGRCGRRLTDPDSIFRGIGPKCLKIMGLDKGDRNNGKARID